MRTDKGTDRQTDMTKLIVAFQDFANVPTNINKQYLEQQLKVICCEPKTCDLTPGVKLTTKPKAEAASQDTV